MFESTTDKPQHTPIPINVARSYNAIIHANPSSPVNGDYNCTQDLQVCQEASPQMPDCKKWYERCEICKPMGMSYHVFSWCVTHGQVVSAKSTSQYPTIPAREVDNDAVHPQDSGLHIIPRSPPVVGCAQSRDDCKALNGDRTTQYDCDHLFWQCLQCTKNGMGPISHLAGCLASIYTPPSAGAVTPTPDHVVDFMPDWMPSASCAQASEDCKYLSENHSKNFSCDVIFGKCTNCMAVSDTPTYNFTDCMNAQAPDNGVGPARAPFSLATRIVDRDEPDKGPRYDCEKEKSLCLAVFEDDEILGLGIDCNASYTACTKCQKQGHDSFATGISNCVTDWLFPFTTPLDPDDIQDPDHMSDPDYTTQYDCDYQRFACLAVFTDKEDIFTFGIDCNATYTACTTCERRGHDNSDNGLYQCTTNELFPFPRADVANASINTAVSASSSLQMNSTAFDRMDYYDCKDFKSTCLSAYGGGIVFEDDLDCGDAYAKCLLCQGKNDTNISTDIIGCLSREVMSARHGFTTSLQARDPAGAPLPTNLEIGGAALDERSDHDCDS